MYYFSITLAILASVAYHLIQKFIPAGANPMVSISITYLASLLLGGLVLLVAYPLQGGLAAELRRLNWASVALAIALVGLELGFLLVYRSGWNVSLAALIVNIAATLLLIPLGLWLFHEKVSAVNIIGIGVCLAGLVMVNWKAP
ncbi:MAG: EamA family transporter [Anaerolineales bacterium]|nr:EamA family transporter [Anaerolineales bacterium]